MAYSCIITSKNFKFLEGSLINTTISVPRNYEWIEHSIKDLLEQLKVALEPRYAGSLAVHKTKGGYADETPLLELKEKTGIFGWFGRRLLYIRVPEEGWNGQKINVVLQDSTVLQDVKNAFAKSWPEIETSIEIR